MARLTKLTFLAIYIKNIIKKTNSIKTNAVFILSTCLEQYDLDQMECQMKNWIIWLIKRDAVHLRVLCKWMCVIIWPDVYLLYMLNYALFLSHSASFSARISQKVPSLTWKTTAAYDTRARVILLYIPSLKKPQLLSVTRHFSLLTGWFRAVQTLMTFGVVFEFISLCLFPLGAGEGRSTRTLTITCITTGMMCTSIFSLSDF